jgi:phosphate transport system protein
MQHFEQDISSFKEKLIGMASRAEAAASHVMLALRARNNDQATRIIAEDTMLDLLELEIDNTTIELLAKAPLAKDLRLITVGMKTAHELERIGDEATKIARRVLELNLEPPLKEYVDIYGLAESALAILKSSLDAFVKQDSKTARSLIDRDKEIDALNRDIQTQLASLMSENRDNVSRCLKLMVVAKSLERIADHAVNIAEEVVFLYEAEDIRHAKHFRP